MEIAQLIFLVVVKWSHAILILQECIVLAFLIEQVSRDSWKRKIKRCFYSSVLQQVGSKGCCTDYFYISSSVEKVPSPSRCWNALWTTGREVLVSKHPGNALTSANSIVSQCQTWALIGQKLVICNFSSIIMWENLGDEHRGHSVNHLMIKVTTVHVQMLFFNPEGSHEIQQIPQEAVYVL